MTAVSDADGVIALLPDLQIEVADHEDLLILQQTDYSGNAERISIHRWQVRLLAEEMGLLPPAPPSPRHDVELILARRLRKLHKRIDELAKHLALFVDDDFAKQHSLATCELGDEFVADLDELGIRGASAASSHALAQQPALAAAQAGSASTAEEHAHNDLRGEPPQQSEAGL